MYGVSIVENTVLEPAQKAGFCMGRRAKVGVPWDEIKARFEAGETASKLQHEYDVTRQAITQRARKEGWDKTKVPTHPEASKALRRYWGRRTNANADIICQALSVGMPPRQAVRKVGMAIETYDAWRDEDSSFCQKTDEAIARWSESKYAQVNQAGDWKAASEMLSRHPVTKDDWGAISGGGAGGINVIINVPRPTQEGLDKALIDITASVQRVE